MSQYAQNTNVSTDKSRTEIERTLQRYGADQFMYGWDQEKALISFRMIGKQIKFILAMPNKSDFKKTDTGRQRKENQIFQAWEQACRQKWRALSLVIKAKLEAVEAGISIFEEEFLSNIVLPDGSTVGDFMLPQVKHAYKNGNMPKLLGE